MPGMCGGVCGGMSESRSVASAAAYLLRIAEPVLFARVDALLRED